MRPLLFRFRAAALLLTAVCLCAVGTACGSRNNDLPAPGSVEADKFLYERGADALAREKWLTAREYFRRLVDTYPRSPFRKRAKLGIGDTYLGEGRIDSLILAANEYREFLTFFPLDEFADEAQYKLALALSRQMLKPQRDQTATIEALREVERFIKAYPQSKYRQEADALHRAARDRLSDAEFKIGEFHWRSGLYVGAVQRFMGILKDDPGYTRKDAVYFHLGDTYLKAGSPAEALPYFERLLEEFPKSEYVEKAKEKIAEIKRSSDPAPRPAAAGPRPGPAVARSWAAARS
jgi:outer membrane protein assembly factor BamD